MVRDTKNQIPFKNKVRTSWGECGAGGGRARTHSQHLLFAAAGETAAVEPPGLSVFPVPSAQGGGPARRGADGPSEMALARRDTLRVPFLVPLGTRSEGPGHPARQLPAGGGLMASLGASAGSALDSASGPQTQAPVTEAGTCLRARVPGRS